MATSKYINGKLQGRTGALRNKKECVEVMLGFAPKRVADGEVRTMNRADRRSLAKRKKIKSNR